MRYTHYGWLVSPYSAKTRAYLRFKNAPFEDVAPTARVLMGAIRKAVHRPVMPTVRVDDGTWLQDSSVIIDTLEAQLDGASVTPDGPRQRLTSALLEVYADEWLPIASLHYRWNHTENARFALEEFARWGFPRLPGPLGRRLIRPFAHKMRGYLPALGVHPETWAAVERATSTLIADLELHLAQHPYLLGTRPCLGDFSLFGPLWAHLFRDPGSQSLFDEAPSVRSWMERVEHGGGAEGAWLADDAVPETLAPVLRAAFSEQWVYLADLIGAIDAWCEAHAGATRVPRSLGDCDVTIGGVRTTRKLATFAQFKAQRALDAYAAIPPADRPAVDAWLDALGGREAMALQVRHRTVLRDFRPVLQR